MARPHQTPVPVVDLTGTTTDAAAARRAAEEIADACRSVGIFLVTAHGIDDRLITRTQAVSRSFFALPDEAKRRYVSPTGNPFRGWASSDTTVDGRRVRFHEQFEVSRFDTPEALRAVGYAPEWARRAEPNLWPTEPATFESTWKEYFEAMVDLGARLLRLVALALALPPDWFRDKYRREASYLACNLYHSPGEDLQRRLRLLEHSDIGSLTILHQDDGPGGLQFLDQTGRWSDVPSRPGTLVVHLGDLMSMWTNDTWVATRHRVTAPPAGDPRTRVSLPYFQHPDLDARIETIPAFATPSRAPQRPAVVAGEWTDLRIDAYRHRDPEPPQPLAVADG